MKQKELLDHVDRQAIVDAIGRAEKRCSGEIRVHIEPKLHGHDLMAFAQRTFERLGMTKTALRNGVLIFIAAHEQRFAILGDKAIHDKVGNDFWASVAAAMTEKFASGDFTGGIVDAVDQAGRRLAEHFPYQAGDRDELSNEISFGDH